MPEKSSPLRAKQSKKAGIALRTKAPAKGKSRHAAKKSSSLSGTLRVSDRTVSEKRTPGTGRTRRSERLPTPEKTGSTTERRRARPAPPAKRPGKPRRTDR